MAKKTMASDGCRYSHDPRPHRFDSGQYDVGDNVVVLFHTPSFGMSSSSLSGIVTKIEGKGKQMTFSISSSVITDGNDIPIEITLPGCTTVYGNPGYVMLHSLEVSLKDHAKLCRFAAAFIDEHGDQADSYYASVGLKNLARFIEKYGFGPGYADGFPDQGKFD
jgi:hypothetical protein